jgi:prepilin-type N-terminal cleavage/methylation domain-containing protein
MTRVPLRTKKRSAFTLVELMIVILILVILISLLAGAVFKVMARVPEVKTRTEITEMQVALQAFMNDYQLSDPPPSYLLLYENVSLYPANSSNTQVAQSYAFLKKVFGTNLGNTDWNGNGVIDGPGGAGNPWTLYGEQCLVFYLGGIPSNPSNTLTPTAQPAGLGFSTNNMKPSMGTMAIDYQPTNPNGLPGPPPNMGKRRGPYYPFDPSRLIPQLNGGFFVYLDPWKSKTGQYYGQLGGSPYTYLSSRGVSNSYTATSAYGGVAYAFGSGQYYNPNGYQIISAGKDGYFGSGNMTTGIATGAGTDDQANFSSTLLGLGQN